MRRFYLIAFILTLGLIPKVADAQSFSVIQNNVNSGSGTTVVTAFSSNTTAGNAIIVECFDEAAAQNCNALPSDTTSSTFVADHAAVVNGNAGVIVFHAFNIAGGADSVTCKPNVGSFAWCAIFEVSGINAIDQTATGTGHSLSALTAATPTTTLANEFLFGAIAIDPAGGVTYSPGTSYTSIDGSTNVGYAEYRVVSATGTYTASATMTGSTSDWAAQISTYYNTNPIISPTTPLVNPGSTLQINCTVSCGTGGTFTCGAGCLGSITSGGLYTAPVTLVANQSIGGYQLFPPDHIFNTRADTLPLRSDSATLMAATGAATLSFLPTHPISYANGSTPTTTFTFTDTPSNNGVFQLPPWPLGELEVGWFDSLTGNDNDNDHHMTVIDTTNGNLEDIYQYTAQAAVTGCTVNGSNSATCTITPNASSIGFLRVAAQGGRNIYVGSFTGGDTYLNGTFTLTGATNSSITFNITHAVASTSTTGQATALGGCDASAACNGNAGLKYTYAGYGLSTTGSTNAAGTSIPGLVVRSQEFVNALVNGIPIKHALWMSLQNGYICGSNNANACAGNAFGTRHIWPATSEAFRGGGIIPYGMRFRLKASFNISGFSAAAQVLLTACKNYGLFMVDGGLGWQVSIDADNLPATEGAAIREIYLANIAPSNFEVVDDSGLMESLTSGAVNNGEVITYTSSTGTVKTHVNLQGTALNIDTNQYYIMAGTPQQQLVFYASNGTATCGMSPTVGSITSDCKYTAPASVGSMTTTTVTFTSSINSSVKEQMIVYVLPASNFNLRPSNTANFTDSHGVVWYGGQSLGTSNLASAAGCCQADHESSFAGTDRELFFDHTNNEFSGNAQDVKFNFHVPAGKYQITYNNGSFGGVGDFRYMFAQGNQVFSGDWDAYSGGQYKLGTFVANAVVGSDNILTFDIAGQGFATDGDVSSIAIIQISSLAGSQVNSGTTMNPGVKLQ